MTGFLPIHPNSMPKRTISLHAAGPSELIMAIPDTFIQVTGPQSTKLDYRSLLLGNGCMGFGFHGLANRHVVALPVLLTRKWSTLSCAACR